MKETFQYREDALCCEQVNMADIADTFGTPVYVYSKTAIASALAGYQRALGKQRHLICYAVKANSNLAVIELLARQGAGFDIVSGGELARVLKAGGDPGRTIFSGVGKTIEEIRAALDAGICCFNVESAPELQRIASVAASMNVVAPISIRVNPDVDPQTHPYISTGLRENKFGVDGATALRLYREVAAHPSLSAVGIDCHIGSQITEIAPFVEALDRLLDLVDQLADEGIVLPHIDVGGGLGVTYHDEQIPPIEQYIQALTERLAGRDVTLVMEPGRSLVANAGMLLTRVEFLKDTDATQFAIVDAAMNDLIRPSLYSAWQDIISVSRTGGTEGIWDVVGPVCETGDFLGKQRALSLSPGDLLAVAGAGAYGFTMASNYNSRPRPAEVMVDGDQVHLVRARETVASLWAGEQGLPDATT